MPYRNDDLEMPDDLEDIEILPMGDFNNEGRHEQFRQRQDHQIEESGPLVLENQQPHAPSTQHQAYPVEESGPMIPEGFGQPQGYAPFAQQREQSGQLVLRDHHQAHFPIQHHHQLHQHQYYHQQNLPMPGPPQNSQNFSPYPFHPSHPLHHHIEFDHHQLRHQIFLEIKGDFDRKAKQLDHKAKEFDRKSKDFDRKSKDFDRKVRDFDRRDKEKDQIFKVKLEEKDNQIRERDHRIEQLERQLAQQGTSAHTSFHSPETPRDLYDMPAAQPIYYDSEDELPEQGFLNQREARWFLERTFGGRPWMLKIQDDTAYLFDPINFRHIKQEKRKVSGATYIYRSSTRGTYPRVLWKDLPEHERMVWNELHKNLSDRQQREIEKGLIKIKERSTVIKREPSDDGYERAANGMEHRWQVQQVPVAMPYAPGPPYLYHQQGMPMPPPHPMWHVPPQQFQGPQNGWMGGPMMHFQMPQGAMHGQMPMDMQHRMPQEPIQVAPVPRKHVQIKEEIIDEDD